MINPIKKLRLENELTQEQLAKLANVTRQVVVHAEQGLYRQPPSSLVVALTRPRPPRHTHDNCYEAAILIANYTTWIDQKRQENSYLFIDVNLESNPSFKSLKNQVCPKSNLGFCKALVYQPSLVREFEKFGRGAGSIFAALRACGVPDDQLRILARVSY